MDKNISQPDNHHDVMFSELFQMDTNIYEPKSTAKNHTEQSTFPPHLKYNLKESNTLNSTIAKKLKIFWKGVILTPTRKQLLTYKGKLDDVKRNLGFRKPKHHEWNLPLEIEWNGSILYPTPSQLLRAGGNLHTLQNIIFNKDHGDTQKRNQKERFQNK